MSLILVKDVKDFKKYRIYKNRLNTFFKSLAKQTDGTFIVWFSHRCEHHHAVAIIKSIITIRESETLLLIFESKIQAIAILAQMAHENLELFNECKHKIGVIFLKGSEINCDSSLSEILDVTASETSCDPIRMKSYFPRNKVIRVEKYFLKVFK